MKSVKSSAAALALIFAVAGAAAAQENADEAAEDEAGSPGRACFSIRQAQSMDALSDRFIFLETSGNELFLLTMTVSCPDMREARGITFASGGRDRVCSGDRVSVAYGVGAGIPPRTCPLDEVESVASREEAEQLVAQRSE